MSDRLTEKDLESFKEKYNTPEKARGLLIEAGLLLNDGTPNPIYYNTTEMKDPVIYSIESALKELSLMTSDRERSITKTKLEEALLWYQFGSRVAEDRGW